MGDTQQLQYTWAIYVKTSAPRLKYLLVPRLLPLMRD